MDYQENANLGYHPKSFIANKAVFHLDSLKITIRNEDLHNVQVLQLTLNTVSSEISQRPSAKHFAFSMTMEALTITGNLFSIIMFLCENEVKYNYFLH